MRLKDFKMRFMPPSSRSFHERMNKLEMLVEKQNDGRTRQYEHLSKLARDEHDQTEMLKEQGKELSDVCAYVLALDEQLLRLSHTIASLSEASVTFAANLEKNGRAISVLQNKLTECGEKINSLAEHRILFNTWLERKYHEQTFGRLLKDTCEIEKRFKDLVRGLDDDSVNTVAKILHRLYKLYENDEQMLDIFTYDEQALIKRYLDERQKNILKISDNLYYYKGKYLPERTFDSMVFDFNYGLDRIETLKSAWDKDIIDAGAYIGDSAVL